jgi:hypothetical protein
LIVHTLPISRELVGSSGRASTEGEKAMARNNDKQGHLQMNEEPTMPKCPQCGRDTHRGYYHCDCGAVLHVKPDGTATRLGGHLTPERVRILARIPGLMAARWVSDRRPPAEEESADGDE